MNWGRAYFGLIVVTFGTLLLLDNLDVLDAGQIVGDWWPLAIIVGGVLVFMANPRHWVMPVILVVGGAAVLLNTTGVVDIVNVLLPALVIVVGLVVIFGRGAGTRMMTSEHRINTFNVFSGTTLNSDSQQFEGGSTSTVSACSTGSRTPLRRTGWVPMRLISPSMPPCSSAASR